MLVANFVKINSECMKLLSNFDVKMSDFKYVEMFSDYENMVKDGDKVSYIVAVLAERYSLSESSVYRILKRFKATF